MKINYFRYFIFSSYISKVYLVIIPISMILIPMTFFKISGMLVLLFLIIRITKEGVLDETEEELFYSTIDFDKKVIYLEEKYFFKSLKFRKELKSLGYSIIFSAKRKDFASVSEKIRKIQLKQDIVNDHFSEDLKYFLMSIKEFKYLEANKISKIL